MEGKKDEGIRLFSVLPSERARVNMHKLKYVTFHLHKSKNYSGGSKHRWPRRDTPGDIQNLTGQNHKQPDLPDRT